MKRLIMFPLGRTVGRGNLLRLDRRIGDLARRDRPLIAERFVDPLRDLPASEPCGAPGMAKQRRNALRIGCRIEQPQRRVQVDQLAPSRSISRLCISISPAICDRFVRSALTATG